jgi:DNA polymerase-3 subunit delta
VPEATTEKLFALLAKGKPVPALVLIGTDPYLRDLCRNKIIDAYVPANMRDWALSRVDLDGSDWGELFQRAETLPMMASCQVVVAHGAESIEIRGKAGADIEDDDDEADDAKASGGESDERQETLKALAKYLDSPAPFTVILFEVPKLDRRQRLYKILAEKALLIDLQLDAHAARALAIEMAVELGTKIDPVAAALLAEMVDSEPARMRLELEKLAAFTLGRPSITDADVREIVVTEKKNTIWELSEMLSTGRRAEALTFLSNLLREGEQPVAMIGALAWSYRKMIEARALPPTTNGFNAARTLKINPMAAEAAVRNAHRFTKAALLSGLVALAEADSQLKSRNPDTKAFMQFLVARLASSAGAKSASR